MQTDSSKVQLSLSLNAITDKDVIAWCEAQSNLSAAFRDLVRSNPRYTNIMAELKAIREAVENIKTVEATEKPKKKAIKVDSEALSNLDALGRL